MRKFVLLAVGALALAGCNPEAGNPEVRAVLSTACPAANQAYSYYAAVASSGVLSQRTMDRVEFAKSQADALCTNPETATVASVLAAGALVYVRVREASAEARARGAVGYSGDLRRLEGLNARLGRALKRAD